MSGKVYGVFHTESNDCTLVLIKKYNMKLKEVINNDLFKIVLTSIVTALLTLTSSYFLMFSQLEEEQKYWKTRTRVERIQELIDKQTELFESLNSKILLNEALAKDFKVYSASYMTKLAFANKYDSELDKEMTQQLHIKALEYHKEINELGSKIQICELYFGSEVDSLLNPLSIALIENYNRNLILGDSIELENQPGVASYFESDFETIKELTDNRISILKAMRAEIDSNNKVLYFDILEPYN